MQAHAPVVHRHEGDGQHQRDRQRHHHAGPDVDAQRLRVQPQADEAHCQHHGDGLQQHAHEFAHRTRNGLRLVLHLLERDARRQRLPDRAELGAQPLAQLDDVPAPGHRHAHGHHLPALVAHEHLRGIDHAAPHLGDLPELDEAGRTGGRVHAADGHAAQLLDGAEGAGHAHLQVLRAGVEHARAFHGVLRGELREHLVQVQAELRQALLRDLDVDLLRLRAEELHLGHVGHPQQPRAHVLGEDAQLLVGEAIGRQRDNGAVDVAEVVVEEGADHALRQRAAAVVQALAHLVPHARDVFRRRAVLELQECQRLAGLGVAADDVGVGHLLGQALDAVGDLLGHLLRARPRPEGLHHHDSKGEGRVLVLAELEVGR